MDIIERFKRDIIFATEILEEIINQDYENQEEKNGAITTVYCTLKTVASSFEGKKSEKTNKSSFLKNKFPLIPRISKNGKYDYILDKINEQLDEIDEVISNTEPDFTKNDIEEVSIDINDKEMLIIKFKDGNNSKFPFTKFVMRELQEIKNFIIDSLNTFKETPENYKESDDILDIDAGKILKRNPKNNK